MNLELTKKRKWAARTWYRSILTDSRTRDVAAVWLSEEEDPEGEELAKLLVTAPILKRALEEIKKITQDEDNKKWSEKLLNIYSIATDTLNKLRA